MRAKLILLVRSGQHEKKKKNREVSWSCLATESEKMWPKPVRKTKIRRDAIDLDSSLISRRLVREATLTYKLI